MATELRNFESLGDRMFTAAAADYLASSLAELKGVAARCGFRDVAVLLALAEQASESVAAEAPTCEPEERRPRLRAVL